MSHERIALLILVIFILVLPGTVYATYAKFGFRCGTMYCPGECMYNPDTSYHGQPCYSYNHKMCESFSDNCPAGYNGECYYFDGCLFFVYLTGWGHATSVDGDVFVTLQTSFQLSNSETGYTLQPKASSTLNVDDVLNVQALSVGEYFVTGGSDDSPPVYFNQPTAKYTVIPQINGGSCGTNSARLSCNTNSVFSFKSLSTGRIQSYTLENGQSFSQSVFSLSSLSPDAYKLTVKRTYDCEMSGYGTNCPEDRPGNMQVAGDEEWYLIRIGASPAGSCEKGCNSGFVCCENKCRNSTLGVCIDVKGTGVPQWVPK